MQATPNPQADFLANLRTPAKMAGAATVTQRVVVVADAAADAGVAPDAVVCGFFAVVLCVLKDAGIDPHVAIPAMLSTIR